MSPPTAGGELLESRPPERRPTTIQSCMLKHHIIHQGIQTLQIPTKPLSGRLTHHLYNWQAIIHRTGLQNILLDQIITEAVPTSPSILSRPAPIDHGGDHRAVTETSYRGGTTIRGDPQVERPLAARALVSQGRPKGCLLHNTHHHQYRKYLKSIFQGRVYQFTCLPSNSVQPHGYSPKSSNQP